MKLVVAWRKVRWSVVRMYPLGTLNIYCKCCSHSRISITTVIRASTSLQYLTEMCLIIVKLFQSGPKDWINTNKPQLPSLELTYINLCWSSTLSNPHCMTFHFSINIFKFIIFLCSFSNFWLAQPGEKNTNENCQKEWGWVQQNVQK